MFIYSKRINLFITEIKHIIKDVLSREVGLLVNGNRFYNRRQTVSYPIKIVIYNNQSMLGYFDSNFYELGFHECLMHVKEVQLRNIIRHELAHYVIFINYGDISRAHSVEFVTFCQKMGWSSDVYEATISLNVDQNGSSIEENGIFRKVQKLMALATSSNSNEAEQAMIKSQQLLLKHNIESKYIGSENDEKICLKRIMKQKKKNSKMHAIANILETFFVSIVYGISGNFVYLEVLGDVVNVEIAEYVSSVLDSEMEKLWKQAQKNYKLKGLMAKNSFFIGLAKGYCDKVQSLKREYSGEVVNALMVIEKKLVDARALVYPRLRTTRSSAGYCEKSAALGSKMGRNLNINPAVKNDSNSGNLIGHSS